MRDLAAALLSLRQLPPPLWSGVCRGTRAGVRTSTGQGCVWQEHRRDIGRPGAGGGVNGGGHTLGGLFLAFEGFRGGRRGTCYPPFSIRRERSGSGGRVGEHDKTAAETDHCCPADRLRPTYCEKAMPAKCSRPTICYPANTARNSDAVPTIECCQFSSTDGTTRNVPHERPGWSNFREKYYLGASSRIERRADI